MMETKSSSGRMLGMYSAFVGTLAFLAVLIFIIWYFATNQNSQTQGGGGTATPSSTPGDVTLDLLPWRLSANGNNLNFEFSVDNGSTWNEIANLERGVGGVNNFTVI